MEDLTNEVRRLIRNLNLGTKVEQILEEIPLTYHPSKNIGKKKYKGEVILAHSPYHQDTQQPREIYERFTPLDMENIVEQRRITEGALLCDNTPKASIDTHAFVKAWCKGHFHPDCHFPGVFKQKHDETITIQNNLKAQQRALHRCFGHLGESAYNREQASFQPPPQHWCQGNDIHDLDTIFRTG